MPAVDCAQIAMEEDEEGGMSAAMFVADIDTPEPDILALGISQAFRGDRPLEGRQWHEKGGRQAGHSDCSGDNADFSQYLLHALPRISYCLFGQANATGASGDFLPIKNDHLIGVKLFHCSVIQSDRVGDLRVSAAFTIPGLYAQSIVGKQVTQTDEAAFSD